MSKSIDHARSGADRPFYPRIRGSHKRAYRVLVGDLRSDPTELAVIIQAGSLEGQTIVWADDHHTVFMSAAIDQSVPEHWIIGLYLLGTDRKDIERDIIAMLQSRMRDWVMD